MRCKNPIKIGATFSIDITRVSNDEPVNLTGVDIESYLKHPKFGNYEMDVEITNAAQGQVKLSLDADTTASMLAGDYTWDIAFTDTNGEVEIFPKDNEVIITFIKGATK